MVLIPIHAPDNLSATPIPSTGKSIMSPSQINPAVNIYLNFNGRCEEAIEFYIQALGAKLTMMMRYKDNPDPLPPGVSHAGMEEKVMHASFRIGHNVIMASDGGCKASQEFKGFTISLTVANEVEADTLFGALADGGEVYMPLMKTFFSPRFGMIADKFGISWMVLVQGQAAA
jgi:PhnB protein